MKFSLNSATKALISWIVFFGETAVFMLFVFLGIDFTWLPVVSFGV